MKTSSVPFTLALSAPHHMPIKCLMLLFSGFPPFGFFQLSLLFYSEANLEVLYSSQVLQRRRWGSSGVRHHQTPDVRERGAVAEGAV